MVARGRRLRGNKGRENVESDRAGGKTEEEEMSHWGSVPAKKY